VDLIRELREIRKELAATLDDIAEMFFQHTHLTIEELRNLQGRAYATKAFMRTLDEMLSAVEGKDEDDQEEDEDE